MINVLVLPPLFSRLGGETSNVVCGILKMDLSACHISKKKTKKKERKKRPMIDAIGDIPSDTQNCF